MICTVLAPNAPWPTKFERKHTAPRDTTGKVLACIRYSPGLTSDQITERTGTTIHYCREVLKKLQVDGKITKTYEGNAVFTYWAVQA